MYYELYADSLFLVNFVMNLYLLLLVNRSTFRTATRRRLVLGAMSGAICYLLPFLWSSPAGLKYGVGIGMGTILMIFVTFRVGSFSAFVRLLSGLCLYSFLLGGMLLFLIGRIPFLRDSMVGILGILGMGGLGTLFCTYVLERRSKKQNICQVTLINGENRMKVAALVDSGNGLMEPISEKPVSVIDEVLLRGLWSNLPDYYRAIPFHSIGKSHGILRGYLLPELQIEMDGVVKICRDVYVAVGKEALSGDLWADASQKDQGCGIRMILNPLILNE